MPGALTAEQVQWMNDALGVQPGANTGGDTGDAPAGDDTGDAPAGDDAAAAQTAAGPAADPGPDAGSAASAVGAGSQPTDQPSAIEDGTGEDAGASQAVPLDAGSSACTEQPTFTDSSDVPVDVTGDTIEDFVRNANAGLGGNPHCTITVSWNPEAGDDGHVTRGNVTVATAIVRPRLGLSRASDAQRALIQKAVDLIRQHEERHRAIVRETYAPSPCALVGKTAAQISTIMDGFDKKHDAAQQAFDAAHGRLRVVYTNGVATDVTTGPL